jgi:hypothetical protein
MKNSFGFPEFAVRAAHANKTVPPEKPHALFLGELGSGLSEGGKDADGDISRN